MAKTSLTKERAPLARSFRWDFERRQLCLSFVLLLPAVVTVLVLIVYPLYQILEISFREGKVMNFARIGSLPLGWDNYARVLSDMRFWQSTGTSALYVGGSVGAALLIGLGTALLLNQRLPGNRFFRTVLLLPWAVPGVIVSIMFLWIMDGSFGVFNAMLRELGLITTDQAWFVDGRTALLAVMLPTIWKTYPLITLTILAALQSIPKELYEAAEVDGVNRLQRFVFITWPGIQGATALVVMVSCLGVFRDVDVIFATTGGGPANATQTLSIYVYKEAFQYFRMGTAAAVGTLMILVSLLVTILLALLARRSKY